MNGCVNALSHSVPVKKEYEACIAELSRPYEGSMPAEEYQDAYNDYLNHMNECLTENAITDKTSYDINEATQDFYLQAKEEVIYVYCDNLC
jgi:Tfp pilus assembly major pilin PilA